MSEEIVPQRRIYDLCGVTGGRKEWETQDGIVRDRDLKTWSGLVGSKDLLRDSEPLNALQINCTRANGRRRQIS